MRAKVLHTITDLNVGGAEIMLARFLGRLDPATVSSSVLSLLAPGALAARVAAANANVVSIDMTARAKPRDALGLALSVKRAAPDLLHGWMYHGNLAASLGSVLGLAFAPVIWSVHHTIADMAKEKVETRRLIAISARLSRYASAISYCSRAAAEDHEKLGFDPRRRVVIPNGIDCTEFHDGRPGETLRALIGIPAGRLVVGHVARFHPMKDQTSLVRALARIAGMGHDVQGVFIGDGHVDGPVRETARALGIDDRITTLGMREDIADLLPGFDVFALSSAWGEAFPLAVGEAMASGVPAVATDVGDCGWLVGQTGLVVRPSDHDALTAALVELIALKPEERRALGRLARIRVIENFSLSLYVERHLELYERAIEGRRSAGAARQFESAQRILRKS